MNNKLSRNYFSSRQHWILVFLIFLCSQSLGNSFPRKNYKLILTHVYRHSSVFIFNVHYEATKASPNMRMKRYQKNQIITVKKTEDQTITAARDVIIDVGNEKKWE